MIRRVICVVLLLFIYPIAAAYDSRINSALELIDKDALRPVSQILFYELGFISYGYKNHYALTTEDNEILINSKYRNAPREALAALIAHELAHFGARADLEEEVAATIAGVNQWKKTGLSDNSHPLVLMFNELSRLYDEGGRAAIYKKITDNESYETLR